MTEDELIVHFFQFDGNFNSQVTLYYVISFKHVPYFISYIFASIPLRLPLTIFRGMFGSNPFGPFPRKMPKIPNFPWYNFDLL